MKTTLEVLQEKYPSFLLTVENLAEIFNKHKRTIFRELNSGALPLEKVNGVRFRVTDVANFIDKRHTQKTNKGRPLGSKNKPKESLSPSM